MCLMKEEKDSASLKPKNLQYLSVPVGAPKDLSDLCGHVTRI